MKNQRVKEIAIALHTETKQGDHSEQTRKNNALMLKMDRERESRRTGTPEVYASSDVPGNFGFVGCESDQYETREAAEQARDRAIIDTIDTEAPPTCWTGAQSAAWNRELDRDKARPWVREGESFRQWITRLNLADNHDNWEKWADESYAEREKRLAAYCSPYPKPRNKAELDAIRVLEQRDELQRRLDAAMYKLRLYIAGENSESRHVAKPLIDVEEILTARSAR